MKITTRLLSGAIRTATKVLRAFEPHKKVEMSPAQKEYHTLLKSAQDAWGARHWRKAEELWKKTIEAYDRIGVPKSEHTAEWREEMHANMLQCALRNPKPSHQAMKAVASY